MGKSSTLYSLTHTHTHDLGMRLIPPMKAIKTGQQSNLEMQLGWLYFQEQFTTFLLLTALPDEGSTKSAQ